MNRKIAAGQWQCRDGRVASEAPGEGGGHVAGSVRMEETLGQVLL